MPNLFQSSHHRPLLLLLLVSAVVLLLLAIGTIYGPYLSSRAARQAARGVAQQTTVEVVGALEILHADFFDEGRSEESHQLRTDKGDYFTLQLDAATAQKLPAGARVRLQGRKTDQFNFQVDTVEILPSETPASQSSQVRGTATEKKVAVILFNFENDVREPFSPDVVREEMFTGPRSVNAYFQETSFAQLSLSGDVYGWYTVTPAQAGVQCTTQQHIWLQNALGKAQQVGFDQSAYDYLQFVFPVPPGVPSCPGGNGTILGKNSSMLLFGYTNYRYRAATAAHELGHNFGLHHANAFDCAPEQGAVVSLNNRCQSREYGDPYSVMGSSQGFRQLNNYHKNLLTWINPTNVVDVTKSGEYPLYPIEQGSPPGAQLLRVKAGTNYDYSGTETVLPALQQYLYLEYRQPLGTFDNFSPADSVVNGISLRLASLGADNTWYLPSRKTNLVDAAPEDGQSTVLTVGQTLTDPISGVSITTLSVSPTQARVRINLPEEDVPNPPNAPATVLGAHLFYNNSGFDGPDAANMTANHSALASDKIPLRPGQAASTANISGYNRGINGLFVDIANLPPNIARLDAADFEFRVGNNNNIATWTPVPAPARLVIVIGAGRDDSARIHITFPDNAITNTWLKVTIKANADTGLAEPYTFFYGSAVGETGATFTPNLIGADAADLQSISQNLTPLERTGQEPITNPHDLNKDGSVNAFDLQVIAQNLNPNILNPITPQ